MPDDPLVVGKSPVILAIDCSDRACSVALGDTQTLIEEYTDEPRQHAKKLLPMYRELLAKSPYQQSDIEAIAIAEGPGSFTGLRIGFSFAQGLAFSLSVPLVKVSSLEALAVSNYEAINNQAVDQIQVCLDARMSELYVAAFYVDPDGVIARQFDDALIGEGDFDLEADYSSSALLGSGFALEAMSCLEASVLVPEACIRASAVHKIGLELFSQGKTSNAVGAEPAYLRRENAWKTLSQQKEYQQKQAAEKLIEQGKGN